MREDCIVNNTFVSNWGAWNNKVKNLSDGKKNWANIVFNAAKEEIKFQETKRNSPFADKIVIAVSYHNSVTSMYGDIYAFSDANGGIDVSSSIVKNAIRLKGWAVHDADEYLLVFDGNNNAEIFWMGCRKSEVKSPKSAGRKRN